MNVAIVYENSSIYDDHPNRKIRCVVAQRKGESNNDFYSRIDKFGLSCIFEDAASYCDWEIHEVEE